MSMWRSYLDSGLPRSLSMSKKVRFFLAFDLLLEDFFDSVDVTVGVADGLADPVANGLESKFTDFPPTGDAEA